MLLFWASSPSPSSPIATPSLLSDRYVPVWSSQWTSLPPSLKHYCVSTYTFAICAPQVHTQLISIIRTLPTNALPQCSHIAIDCRVLSSDWRDCDRAQFWVWRCIFGWMLGWGWEQSGIEFSCSPSSFWGWSGSKPSDECSSAWITRWMWVIIRRWLFLLIKFCVGR